MSSGLSLESYRHDLLSVGPTVDLVGLCSFSLPSSLYFSYKILVRLYSTAWINLGARSWKGRKVRGYSSCKWGQKLKYFTFYSFWRNAVNTERVSSPLTHNTQMLKVSYLHLLPCSSSSVEVPSDWTQNSFLRILKPLWSNGSLFSFCHHEWWEELIISIAIWPRTSFCEI